MNRQLKHFLMHRLISALSFLRFDNGSNCQLDLMANNADCDQTACAHPHLDPHWSNMSKGLFTRIEAHILYS